MPTHNPMHRRKIKLIKPGMQLRLVGVFVGLSGLGFLLQTLHVGLRLSELAANAPEGGPYIMAVLPELPLEVLAVSFGMLLPLTVAIGVIVTFRLAGPIYRFERYLRDVTKGIEVRPCTLRDGDELQDLCELINEVTEPIRLKNANESSDAERHEDERVAA